jgi:hypothetical protein
MILERALNERFDEGKSKGFEFDLVNLAEEWSTIKYLIEKEEIL